MRFTTTTLNVAVSEFNSTRSLLLSSDRHVARSNGAARALASGCLFFTFAEVLSYWPSRLRLLSVHSFLHVSLTKNLTADSGREKLKKRLLLFHFLVASSTRTRIRTHMLPPACSSSHWGSKSTLQTANKEGGLLKFNKEEETFHLLNFTGMNISFHLPVARPSADAREEP